MKVKKISIAKKLRPTRLAFLVAKEDKRTLREVFRINTCLWGGFYNLIIPFFRKTPKNWEKHRYKLPSASSILKGYLDSFDPDYVVVKDKEILSALFDKERLLLFGDILNIKNDSPVSYGVDVTDLYWHLYDKEFKFERRHPIKVVFPKPSRELALLSACCFGEFPTVREIEYVKKNYEHCFSPKVININKENFLNCFVNEGASPLRLTKAELQSLPRGWRAEPSVFFMDATSWLDIVDFWNLRAVGREVLPLPKQSAEHCIDLCNRIMKHHYVPYRHNKDMMHHTNFICSRSSNMKELEAFSKKLTSPGEGAISLQHWYPRMWDEWAKDKDHVELCSIQVEDQTEEVSMDDAGYIKFKTISPKFVEKYAGTVTPRWLNVIRITDSYNRYDCPTVFPGNLKNVSRVMGNIGIDRIWTSREGINIPCKHVDWSQIWKIPVNLEIFQAYFKEQGFSIALSSPGRILLKIIESVDGLHGVRIFQDEELIKLINKMSHSAVEIEIEDIHEQLSKSKVRAKTVPVKSLMDLLKKINRNSAEVAQRHLRQLISCKIIRGGISIQCPECLQHTWYSLNDLADKIICERCLEKFDFPFIRPVPESSWHFRSIGPFSIENYAQGGYCVALALRFLVGNSLSTAMTWIPSFIIKGKENIPIEIDFGAFLSQGRIDESKSPMMIFGECKSFNDQFTNKNVKNMRQLAEKFPGSMIVFCTLRAKLTDRERKTIAKLARRGRHHFKAERWINPVLILTSIELFSFLGPPYCWKDRGDPYSRFANTYRGYDGIQELCDVTQQMHLGIESYREWYEQRRRKRLGNRTSKSHSTIE